MAALSPHVFTCLPCGIRFSSLSTLEAHQTYYCSHRQQPPTPTHSKSSKAALDSDSEDAKSVGGGASSEAGDSTDTTIKPTPPPPLPCRTGKQYACPHCSYSADKKVSLNRHMRMHAASPPPPPPPPPPASVTPVNGDQTALPEAVDRYCQDCDIRFSSTKTFRAHKQHYCSTRHVVKGPKAPSSPETPPPQPSSSPPQPFLALPTNPVLLVPYSLLRGASLLPGPAALGQDAACILLPNGTLQPMNGSSPPPAPLTSDSAPSPLDLSVKRSTTPVDSDGEEKENLCVASPATSAASSGDKRQRAESRSQSPDAKRRAISPKNGVKLAMEPSEEILKTAAVLAAARAMDFYQIRGGDAVTATASAAPVLVKQGVSKCRECNIVFCRHENFLAHKRHYCSARPTPVAEEATSPPAVSPPSPQPPPPPPTGPTLLQFICVPCGIKFTSYDNLTAHQVRPP